jgi:hypothetical protein
MKLFERSKSNTRSMTPKRILIQKPPFPKLIQKKPKVLKLPIKDQNKENIPLDEIVPKDSLLIKPNETINQPLYTQSPLGEFHICFPYELPNKLAKFHLQRKSFCNESGNSSEICNSSTSSSRNNKVKLLSTNFKINRTALTGYGKGLSHNSTPEPREYFTIQ